MMNRMRAAKSIDELYQEVKDHSLVISNEISLVTALNNRIGKARIGVFAATPQQIARLMSVELIGRQVMDDSAIVGEILSDPSLSEFDLNRRYVHGEIVNYRHICRYTERPSDFIYTKSAKAICARYSEMKATLEYVMRMPELKRCSLYSKGRIAVIGEDLFDTMDRAAIPEKYDSIQIFKDEAADLDKRTVYKIGNDRQIAEHVISLIDKEDAGSYAIVFDPESNILKTLRTEMYRRDIRFIDRAKMKDLISVRNFIRILEQGLRFDVLERKEVEPLFMEQGLECYMRKGQRFRDYSTKYHALEIKQAMFGAYSGNMTFGEAANLIYNGSRKPKDTIMSLLNHLHMNDTKVNRDSIADLSYMCENMSELSCDELNELSSDWGVLMVDCHNSAFVDRNNIIYVGMENDWDIQLSGKRYIADPRTEYDICAKRCSLLLQQGDVCSRVYVTHSSSGGEDSKPALIFNEICGRPIDDFSEIFANVEGMWQDPGNSHGAERLQEVGSDE